MNICEGLCYAFFATLAILIVGFPISIVASREISIATFGGNVVPYKFPVLEMGLFILVLFGMELILSVWTIRRQKKQSLIEQMRAMDSLKHTYCKQLPPGFTAKVSAGLFNHYEYQQSC